MTPSPENQGPARIGDVSFWYANSGLPEPRAALLGNQSADICIIGAGFTGLWTAYYLKEARPELKIVIVEKDFAGFGASGRNGGWLSGGFAWNHENYAKTHGEDATRAMVQAMNDTVAEVISVARAHHIQADILPTDELLIARNPAQYARMMEEAIHRRRWGEEDRISIIGTEDLARRIHIPDALGAMVITGVARVQPAKLVRGLARVVESMGVKIYENTEVIDYSNGLVACQNGHITAPIILRATEGFTPSLRGRKREVLPLNSAQVITAPLPEKVWNQIGWAAGEIIGDMANDYFYSQRTADGRIAIGARGVPYRFGSRLDDKGTPDQTTIDRLIKLLHERFPATIGQPIDHAWCGVLGVPRDWCASIGFDRETGLGYAGGYVGVGVSTSNLAGRSLRDLVLGHHSELTQLPWVNRNIRQWEPEPLRYLGVNGMYKLMHLADKIESQKGRTRPSKVANLAKRLMGRG